MEQERYFKVVWMCLMIVCFIGCKQSSTSEEGKFSELALQGKQIFEKNECNSCHPTGETTTGDSLAPNLSHPFLANDSLFVQAHLKFLERTSMPPIELAEREIRLVSYYIAELHNSRLPELSEEEIDTYDPVCYAPVSIAQAKEAGLFATFLGKKYYFATRECLETFLKAPEAFLELYRQYQEEQATLQTTNK